MFRTGARRFARVAVLALALLLPGLALVPAHAATTVTVTVAKGEGKVGGAFVALLGESGRFGGVTGNDASDVASFGQVVFSDVPDGSYTADASAPGTTVGVAEVTVAGSDPQVGISVEDSGNKFKGMGAYGAQTTGIIADGASGVFYLSTSSVPSLFRTGDFGGHWAPVTIRVDDPLAGIDGTQVAAVPTTSGFPGEVAAIVGNRVWYSRDFGNTWVSIPAPPTGMGGLLLWGHPRAGISMLFVVNGSNTAVYYARMPVGPGGTAPTAFTQMPSSYKEADGDRVWIANGETAPIFAVASAAGTTVKLYAVDENPSRAGDATSGPITAAPGTMPTFIRIGGPAAGQTIGVGAAPSTILVYSDGANAGKGGAVMTSWSGGAWVSTTSTIFHNQDNDQVNGSQNGFNDGPAACGGQAGSIGSASPLGGAGTVSMCWVSQAGTGLTEMHVRQVRGINNNTGIAFDAGYNGEANQVVISGDGEKGATKSADQAPGMNRPRFYEWPVQAKPGTAADSGGVAVDGLDAAVVKDTAFGPGGASQVAVALSFTGGGRILASADSGETWQWVHAEGGSGVDWWLTDSGSNESWILSNGNGLLLAGTDVPADVASNADLPQNGMQPGMNENGPGGGGDGLAGSGPADFGWTNGDGTVSAIVGLPGSRMAYVGSSQGNETGPGKLHRVTLSGTRAGNNRRATVARPGELSAIDNRPVALAACPDDPALPESTRDKVYAALASNGESDSGGIAVVSAASGEAPTVATPPGASGDFNDVRADCATGDVWAGKAGGGGPGSAALVHSADGGATFEPVPIAIPQAPPMNEIETLAVNENNPDEVVIVDQQGDVATSTDGGDNWILKNNAQDPGGRNFGGERPGDIEIPPEGGGIPVASIGAKASRVRAAAAGVAGGEALLGSGSGLFSADVRSSGDSTPPSAPVIGGLARIQSGNRFTVSWSASEDPESGVATYVVDYLRARLDSTTPVAVPGYLTTPATSMSFPASTGYFYCFVVHARNGVGLTSTSGPKCTAVPANNTDLKHSAGWKKMSNQAGSFLRSYSESKSRGAALTLAVRGAKQIYLIVTKCPGCGKVDVLVGSSVVAKQISLNGAKLARGQVVRVYSGSAKAGVLKIRVAAPGKFVRIEGLAITR